MADSIINEPSTFDSQGNLSIHGRAAIDLRVQMLNADGTPDTTAQTKDLWFEVSGTEGWRAALLMKRSGDDDSIRYITVKNDPYVKGLILGHFYTFSLLDMTKIISGDVLNGTLHEGTITTRGYTAIPTTTTTL